MELVSQHHLAADLNDIFKTKLMDELKTVVEFSDRLNYEAFSAPRLRVVLETQGKTSPDYVKDLVRLLAIYHTRGANATRLKDRERSRFKDPEVQTEVTNLLSFYSVVDKPNGRQLAVTLPRVSLCYPVISLMVAVRLTVTSAAKKPDEWFMSLNALPAFMAENDSWWDKYIHHQTEMSAKFSRGRRATPEETRNFALVTHLASEVSEANRPRYLRAAKLAVKVRTEKGVLSWDDYKQNHTFKFQKYHRNTEIRRSISEIRLIFFQKWLYLQKFPFVFVNSITNTHN